MKNTAAVALSLIFCTSLFGAETHRYLVATKHATHDGGLTAAVNRAPIDVEPRNVSRFAVVDGFAADLTDAEVEALRQSDEVRAIEPLRERHAFDVERMIGAQTLPYGVVMLRAPMAWNARSAGDVNVVVIDTGIDYRHPELAASFRGGYDFVNSDEDPLDDNGHGTHVSGTIAAKNDKQGVVGVAPGMRLYALKVLNASGNGNSENVIKALDWIVAKKKTDGGRWVVNLSLGSAELSDLERDAFLNIIDQGVIVIAASGNSSTPSLPAPVSYPAAYPGVVAIGAVDSKQKIATFSNQGPELDFVAPGLEILSTVRVGTSDVSFIVNNGTATAVNAVEGSGKGQFTGEYVFCGLGKEGEITDKVRGKIALIRRGEIPFSEKTKRAQQFGAAAVVIFNNETTYSRWTMFSSDDPTSYTYPWPLALSMRQEPGEALAAKGTGTLTVAYINDDYAEKSGTSMAAPHVTGAVAFLWSIAPNATSGALLTAMRTSAIDLGLTGLDNMYGYGLIDLHAAARLLAPGAFTDPVPLPGRPTTGRRMLKH